MNTYEILQLFFRFKKNVTGLSNGDAAILALVLSLNKDCLELMAKAQLGTRQPRIDRGEETDPTGTAEQGPGA